MIDNYPNLEEIVVKKNSLMNLKTLKICDCDKLETIVTEDGSYKCVEKVIFESIF